MSIKDHIKGKVHFVKYHDLQLWYITDDEFNFPVPTHEIGNATFLAEDKAILFMRYIRKHLDFIEKSKTIDETR